jgi:hypothetical protein
MSTRLSEIPKRMGVSGQEILNLSLLRSYWSYGTYDRYDLYMNRHSFRAFGSLHHRFRNSWVRVHCAAQFLGS